MKYCHVVVASYDPDNNLEEISFQELKSGVLR